MIAGPAMTIIAILREPESVAGAQPELDGRRPRLAVDG
jgi:hypothetical protein